MNTSQLVSTFSNQFRVRYASIEYSDVSRNHIFVNMVPVQLILRDWIKLSSSDITDFIIQQAVGVNAPQKLHAGLFGYGYLDIQSLKGEERGVQSTTRVVFKTSYKNKNAPQYIYTQMLDGTKQYYKNPNILTLEECLFYGAQQGFYNTEEPDWVSDNLLQVLEHFSGYSFYTSEFWEDHNANISATTQMTEESKRKYNAHMLYANIELGEIFGTKTVGRTAGEAKVAEIKEFVPVLYNFLGVYNPLIPAVKMKTSAGVRATALDVLSDILPILFKVLMDWDIRFASPIVLETIDKGLFGSTSVTIDKNDIIAGYMTRGDLWILLGAFLVDGVTAGDRDAYDFRLVVTQLYQYFLTQLKSIEKSKAIYESVSTPDSWHCTWHYSGSLPLYYSLKLDPTPEDSASGLSYVRMGLLQYSMRMEKLKEIPPVAYLTLSGLSYPTLESLNIHPVDRLNVQQLDESFLRMFNKESSQ